MVKFKTWRQHGKEAKARLEENEDYVVYRMYDDANLMLFFWFAFVMLTTVTALAKVYSLAIICGMFSIIVFLLGLAKIMRIVQIKNK